MISSAHVVFYTPRQNQEQIIEISFGSDGDFLYRKTSDHSENTTMIERIHWSNVRDAHGEIDWRPWDVAPSVSSNGWVTIQSCW